MKFAGYVVSSYGIKADPNKVATLTKFPLPKARTKLKSFLYLVNQFESSSLTCVLSVELKKLNSTKNAYFWTEIHKAEFKKVKELLAQTTTLDYFDQKQETTHLTNASRLRGLGYTQMQIDSKGPESLIHCGSRSLTSEEKNYSKSISKEEQ